MNGRSPTLHQIPLTRVPGHSWLLDQYSLYDLVIFSKSLSLNHSHSLLSLQRVLLFVNHDIDAICAARILQHLFRYDTITYTLVPVSGIQDLRQAFEENCDEVVTFCVLNLTCGLSILFKCKLVCHTSIFHVGKICDSCKLWRDH